MIIENVPYNTIDETQSIIEETIADVEKAVVATMGPNGRLALIEVGNSVKATKDGVTVARALKFNDPRKELISRVIIEPAVKTDMECGDGTTTTIMLTRLFYDLLVKHTTYLERQFIEGIVNNLIAKLQEMAVSVTLDSDLLYPLALTSSNNDHKLAKAVVEIYQGSNGRFPFVEFKEGLDANDKIINTDEMVMRMTLANPAFSVFGNGMDTKLDKTMPIVVDGTLATTDQDDVTKLMSKLAEMTVTAAPYRDPQNPLYVVFIARNVDHSFVNVLLAVNAIASNATHQAHQLYSGMRFIAVHTNMGGSVGSLLMQDLAIVLGGKMYNTLDQFFDSSSVYVSDEKIVLGTHRSTVKLSVDGQARAQARVEELQKEVGGYQLGEKFSPKAKFTERRMRDLSGSLVTIFVGGETQSDIKERIDRFEDVVKAVRSALENGVLPGVGIALIYAFNKVLEDGGEGILDKKDFAIIRDLTEIVHAQHVYLMSSVIAGSRRNLNSEGVMLQASKDVQDQLYDLQFAQTGTTNGDVKTRPFLVLNLSTGKVGTPEDLGIYDTAYASITALRGGFQTAKILASSSSLLLGNKLGGVRI